MNDIKANSDVTAVLIVLNNVFAVKRCLDSLVKQGLNKIIVIDGGSTDGTIEILENNPCDYHVIGRTGLGHARQYGVDLVKTEFVLLVDSDNIFPDNSIMQIKKYLINSTYAGVAAQKISFHATNLYGKFQEWMNSNNVNKPGEKLVIGTPAIFRTDIIKLIRYNSLATAGDDTDLCFRLRQNGYIVGTSNTKIQEEMPQNLKDFISKAYLYGKSDFQFFIFHKTRRYSIGTHVLVNYLYKLIVKSLIELKVKFMPLVFVYSISRIAGLYFNLFKYYLKKIIFKN